ncbi:hypothetical protein EP56_05600 [Listeriaceae bacterium FSL A5-0209]|nr:hypothetical protein EP56_05600 [Listeriaceae bacterium FSL A5-0209]
MEFIGTIKSITYPGDKTRLIIDIDERVHPTVISRHTHGSAPQLGLEFFDNRKISADQRKKAFAIMTEITRHFYNENYSSELRLVSPSFADDRKSVETALKESFATYKNIERYSLANSDMTTARDFINFLIEFCFMFDVPFHEKERFLGEDIQFFLYMCLKYRKCAITGKAGSDVHHIDAVGMGRNRNKVDSTQFRFICLSREMHNLVHQIGWNKFSSMHKVGAIKLNEKGLKECRIKTQPVSGFYIDIDEN